MSRYKSPWVIMAVISFLIGSLTAYLISFNEEYATWWSMAGIVLLSIAVLTPTQLLICLFLAKNDWFFSLPPEGSIIAVVAGDSKNSGGLIRLIPNIKDHVLNKDGQLIKGQNPKMLFGIYWLGLWPFSHRLVYKFSYARIEQGQMVSKPDRWTDRLIHTYPYAIKITGLEVRGFIEIDFTLVVKVVIEWPYKTLFGIQPLGSWLEVLTALIREHLRDWAGGDITEIGLDGKEVKIDAEYLRQFRYGDDDKANNPFGKTKLAEFNANPRVSKLGVKVEDITVHDFAISSRDERASKALMEKELAELEGLGSIATAEAAAKVTHITARAGVVAAVQKARGELALNRVDNLLRPAAQVAKNLPKDLRVLGGDASVILGLNTEETPKKEGKGNP